MSKSSERKRRFNVRAALVAGGVALAAGCGVWVLSWAVGPGGGSGDERVLEALRTRDQALAAAVSRVRAGGEKSGQEIFRSLVEELVGEDVRHSPLAYVGVVDGSGKLVNAWAAVGALAEVVPGGEEKISGRGEREVVEGIVSGEIGRGKRLVRYSVELPGGGGAVKLGFVLPPRGGTGGFGGRGWPLALWLGLALAAGIGAAAALVAGLVLPPGGGRALAGRVEREAEELEKALVAAGGPDYRRTTASAGLSGLMSSSAGELRKAAEQRARLAPYFPRPVFQKVLSKKPLGGEEKPATVLAVGLEGLDRAMREEPVAPSLDLANTYLDVVVETLRRNGGVVGQVSLYGVLAWWGIYDKVPEAERRAIDAGLQVLREVGELSERQRAVGEPALEVSVGVASGKAMVGRVGSVNRVVPVLLGSASTGAVAFRDAAPAGGLLACEITVERAGGEAYSLADHPARAPDGRKAVAVSAKA
jgi:class 3 adenylate cyclase